MFLLVFYWSLLNTIKFWNHEIPTRKNFRPTKYPREKILDPRNTHEKNFRTHEGTMARWHETHETHDGTRPTEFSTLNVNEHDTYFFFSGENQW